MNPMYRGPAAIVAIVAIVVNLSIWMTACSDNAASGVATTATTTFVSIEVTVTGVVIAVEGNLAGIDSFVIRLEDGSDLTLVPADGLLFDGISPLSHVRDHLVSGSPVEVTYETSIDGPPTAAAIRDAGGGTHGHDG